MAMVSSSVYWMSNNALNKVDDIDAMVDGISRIGIRSVEDCWLLV
jgi:hypothetical protein